MAQKISYEDAFPTFQQKCSELFEANMLLQAQVDTLQRQLNAALEDNARLKQAASEPVPTGGPDLAAQPPFPADDHN
ncbi:hypothetical protein [Streptomyces spinosirectus]